MLDFLEKTLPSSLELERLILGHCLLTGRIDFEIDPSIFYHEGHRKIFRYMQSLVEDGKAPDLITVLEYFRNNGELEKVGGTLYVASLTDGVPSFHEGLSRQYIDALQEKAALRHLIGASQEAMARAYNSEKFEDIVLNLTRVIDTQRERVEPQAGPVDMGTAVGEAYKEIEAIDDARKRGIMEGIECGFRELDRMIPAGLKKDELMLIGGRPGQGKTTLLMALLANMAKKGKRLVMFSMEMGRLRLIMKLLSMESGVPLVNMTTGFVNKEQWVALGKAAGDISQWKLWIDDSTGLTVADIGPRVRRIRDGVDLVALDYLQLLQEPKHLVRATDNEKVGYNSKHLKWLQKSMGIPFIACAQLNRQSDKRRGGKPQMSDLRQSGQIEQDADIIAFIHRDEDGEDGQPGVASVIIGKQRNGPTGEVSLGWDGTRSRFSNLWTGEES